MDGKERRKEIIRILTEGGKPVRGKTLADTFGVSRQVIVQDIAILRAEKHKIASTNTGYLLLRPGTPTRVFKVTHLDQQAEEELKLIVDFGGVVEDVFVYHKIYGTVRAKLNIRSRADIQQFMENLYAGKSSLLKNITAGFHYHTVAAPTDALLDLIQEKLSEKGFLAELQDYEPVDFWNEKGKQKLGK